jgi:hypothetical protein
MNETPSAVDSQQIPDSQQIVASAWRDQAVWSETANHLKAELSTWRNRAAVAGVLGAFLETLAGTLAGLDGGWSWLRSLIALTGAASLAVVPYVARIKVSKDRVREWVRARSASEALKELIYRYLVGAPPFTPASSSAELIERCQSIKEKVQDLNIYAAAIEPPKRERSLVLTVDGYVKNRVNDQIDRYYRPRGREKALAAKRLHDWEFRLGLLAVVMGALVSAAAAAGLPQLSVLASWVAVVTTASAAVTAHLAAARYDHEAIIYLGTADRLAALREKWLADANRMDPARVARFVDDCEHAISTENEAWLAKWVRDRTDAAAEPAS